MIDNAEIARVAAAFLLPGFRYIPFNNLPVRRTTSEAARPEARQAEAEAMARKAVVAPDAGLSPAVPITPRPEAVAAPNTDIAGPWREPANSYGLTKADDGALPPGTSGLTGFPLFAGAKMRHPPRWPPAPSLAPHESTAPAQAAVEERPATPMPVLLRHVSAAMTSAARLPTHSLAPVPPEGG